ncbi:MAG TPA: hypothetical protein VGN72_11830 [Tepidisphaeraceae bacterium]|jgi:hypothetical protein|nr:hypothetical protein [Tepidisphaeraceae bacterium]
MQADEPTDAPATTETIPCPGCDEEIEIDRSAGDSFRCPYCNVSFSLGSGDDDGTTDDGEAERTELERRTDEELDGLRIRQFAAERRAAYRQRSYVIVALGGSAVAAGQLVWMTYQHVRRAGWEWKPIGYVLFAIACAVAAVMLSKQVRAMTRALTASAGATSTSNSDREPDFSTLGDGSDRWQKLNEVR